MKPHAGISINAGVSPTVNGNHGFSDSITRVAAGHYRLVLDNGLGNGEMTISVGLRESIDAPASFGVDTVSVGAQVTMEVKTFYDTALTDLDFNVTVFSLR